MQRGNLRTHRRCFPFITTFYDCVLRFCVWANARRSPVYVLLLLGLLSLDIRTPSYAATLSPKQRIVPLWSRFEQVFVSSFNYTNPLQELTLTTVFTSPQGETSTVQGFWDGGRIWRIRFCPDTPGQWTFSTACSDARNNGLSSQTGKFLCTAPIGDSPFQRHGPIRIAPDRRHFEHADRTPFFWIADTVWNGARLASYKDWQRYASIRFSQAFNVALWSLTPGDDMEYESALNGFPDQIGINPGFFQRLDSKFETLSREGILSAILPLSGPSPGETGKALPADQASLFYRYVLARWGSEPVAWLIEAENQSATGHKDCWKSIEAAFTNSHSPVILIGVDGFATDERLGNLSCVDALGVIAHPDPAIQQNPQPAGPHRPIIVFAPPENGLKPGSQARFSADEVRRTLYENLLNCDFAGVTYAAQGVADWDSTTDASSTTELGRLPVWEKALFMPAAKQMRPLANLMSWIEYWRLLPQPGLLVPTARSHSTQDDPVAASTENKDLTLIYLPQSNPVEISPTAMPPSPNITWLDPRHGWTRSAAAVVMGQSCQFPPPADGDWVLMIKSGK
jgi:Protein of unknown function (DUF4038)/Domain of unknown function (DUF5060)/Putative collagen-binding domain of a collagenase